MIYTGLGRVGEIADVKANGGADVAEVYGGINYQNPIFYSRKTLTGTSPLTFKALGQPLKDYHIFGETIQNGTPSPDYPVDVQGCGERTENLFDKDKALIGYRIYSGSPAQSNDYACTDFIDVKNIQQLTHNKPDLPITSFYFYNANKQYMSAYVDDKPAVVPAGAAYVRVNMAKSSVYDFMLVAGNAQKQYEPYGYKISVAIGNVATPIYIGADPLYRIGEYADEIDFGNQQIIRRIDTATMQPYATPITSTITIPPLTAEVGDNTLSVDTTVKPSAVSVTGNIKPTGYGQLLDVNDVDIQDSTGTPIFIQG